MTVDVFDRFDGGHYGVLQGFRAGKGTFAGTDVQCYLDGSIGPRTGLVPITAVGMPFGQVAGMGYFSQDAASLTWFIVGTVVYASVTAPGAGLTGALTSTPTRPVQGAQVAAKVYIANYGDKIYELTSTNCNPVGGTPGAGCIVAFGDRLLAANSPGLGNRVRFCDANLFTSWPAPNFFDVGQGGEITGMWTIKSDVYIAKNDGTWWLYSGVPGSGADVLRLAYSGLSYPQDFLSGAVVGGTNVWFIAKGENIPSYFNGSNVNVIPEQDTLGQTFSTVATGVQPAVNVVPLSRRGDMIALAGYGLTSRASLLYRDAKWSRHSVAYPLGAPVPGTIGRVLLCDGGAVATQPSFAYWQPAGFERPGLGGSFDATTDAQLATNLTLPEVISKDGKSLQVEKVRVDFRKFNPSTTTTNHFDINVTATRREDDAPDETMPTLQWDEPPGLGSSTGVRDRKTFKFGLQGDGVGYLINFANIRGVIIDRVTVWTVDKGVRL